MDLAPLQASGCPPTSASSPASSPTPSSPAFFRRAALVVLPYARTERFDQSGVLATALAFGTPAVLSAIGGFPEVAELGAAALVPPDDPAALHAALERPARASPRREALAAGGSRRRRRAALVGRAARETLAIYRQIQ